MKNLTELEKREFYKVLKKVENEINSLCFKESDCDTWIEKGKSFYASLSIRLIHEDELALEFKESNGLSTLDLKGATYSDVIDSIKKYIKEKELLYWMYFPTGTGSKKTSDLYYVYTTTTGNRIYKEKEIIF